MALFDSDIIALVVVGLVGLGVYVINKLLGVGLKRLKSLQIGTKTKIQFVYRIFTIAVLVYFIVEGFPLFGQIDPTYTTILTGAISTALAFASSGIFSNLVSGIALILIKPFEIGDVIKINEDLGVVRSIRLTRVVIETFDNIKVVKSNSEIISSNIVNFSMDITKIRKFVDFKDTVHYAEKLFPSMLDEVESDEESLKQIFNIVFKPKKKQKLHNYIWTMELPYKGFLVKIDQIETLCKGYKDKFGFEPRFHVSNIGRDITLRFRIMTYDTAKIFNKQPEFAHDLYEIIHQIKEE